MFLTQYTEICSSVASHLPPSKENVCKYVPQKSTYTYFPNKWFVTLVFLYFLLQIQIHCPKTTDMTARSQNIFYFYLIKYSTCRTIFKNKSDILNDICILCHATISWMIKIFWYSLWSMNFTHGGGDTCIVLNWYELKLGSSSNVRVDSNYLFLKITFCSFRIGTPSVFRLFFFINFL
jgi:hypothetical protein